MSWKTIYLLVIIYYLKGVLSSCEDQTTCHGCIQDASGCVWCSSVKHGSEARCKPESSDKSWCKGSLENPQNKNVSIVSRPFSSDLGDVTQIKPQKYEIELRPGKPFNFPFSFKGAQDYPVDLYFLFDASLSMKTVKKHTSDQSEEIYKTMRNMTKNVYLGMGTFIDKNTLPFTLNVTDYEAYSFRHRLNLTEDYMRFKEAVEAAPVGRNRDIPEGGLDAISQAIVCKQQIGWRNESRKIIILITNGPYHTAGDGRSGGIFQPYDGKCYTTADGVYTKELEMDYPSVSMINKLARENEVTVIFAVSYKYNYVYKDLGKAISGAKTEMLDLATENDNIVTTLQKIYKDITKNIKLNVKIISGRRKNFEISFDPDCTQSDNNDCNVGSGTETNFTGTIKLLKYDGNDKAGVGIGVEGINEKLFLDIHVIKDCECESIAVNSEYCNNELQECGICKCSEKRYGDRCACEYNIMNNVNDTSTCIAEGMTQPCSGSGMCFCGACQCDEGHVGRYCQCNKNNCPLSNGETCSGQGECQCDHTCKCNSDRSGKACECIRDDELCTGYTKKVCNNRGTCDCGSCDCNPIADWDGRNHQDKYCIISACPECHDRQCQKLTECALCHIKESDSCNCSFAGYELLDELHEDWLNNNSTDWHVCRKVRVDVGCYTNFTYMYDEDDYRIILKVQKKKDCAEIYYIYGGTFLLVLLLVGLFTMLAWKLFTEARDRQEYLKFVKDHEEDISGPCENPLYEPASTTFRNPTFRKISANCK